MNPPTEQLVRDYLNRLSLAARGKLEAIDRQSLLDRTRARIEAECGGTSAADATEVRKALAGLGDPIAIVELEHAKVSVDQVGEDGGATAMQAEPDRAVNGSAAGAAAGRPESTLLAGASASEAAAANEGPAASEGPSRVEASSSSGEASAAQNSFAAESSGAARDPGLGRPVPAPREPPEGAPALLAAPDPPGNEPGGPKRDQAGPGNPGAADSSAGPPVVRPVAAGPRRPRPEDVSVSGPGAPARLAAAIMDIARNHAVELIAVLLLGVGGAVYPPIWLIGAALALPSKKWDIRDKFFGITLPVLLVIVGTVLILVFGGQQSSIGEYAREAWLGAERLSRLLAVVGGGYLLWGLRRGRRVPKQPPWNVPHKLG